LHTVKQAFLYGFFTKAKKNKRRDGKMNIDANVKPDEFELQAEIILLRAKETDDWVPANQIDQGLFLVFWP